MVHAISLRDDVLGHMLRKRVHRPKLWPVTQEPIALEATRVLTELKVSKMTTLDVTSLRLT